jgi:UDP-glucose 4-epimerase
MKYLVTGGAGFIGSHMVDLLLKRKQQVVVIDNLASGNLKNLEHHKSNPDLTLVIDDISNHDGIVEHFKGIDVVFHFAALADIVPSIDFPMKYHNSNVNGTISVLESCRKHNVKRIIYAASSSCYGLPDKFPTDEQQPIKCQYPYAVTKYMGEEYAIYWHKIYKMNITSMRFFNVYGPRSRTSGTYGAVFGVFLAQKINNQPYTVVGDGSQTRDFTFVTDIVEACYIASENNHCAGEIFNVGSGNTYSINQLVQLLGGPVVHIPKRPGEPDSTYADISKIRRVLNWNPKISFEEGIKIMLDNINYWKDAPIWNPESIKEATRDWFKYLG